MMGVQLTILVAVMAFDVKDLKMPTVTGLVGVKLAILVTVLAFGALAAPFS